MAFTPIALGTLTLSPCTSQYHDRVTIPLTHAPDEAWRAKFGRYPFTVQMAAPEGQNWPAVHGDAIVVDADRSKAAVVVAQIKAAVAATNEWYATVQEPANVAAAAAVARAAQSSPIDERAAELNALLAG
jgi:hypothetical protein